MRILSFLIIHTQKKIAAGTNNKTSALISPFKPATFYAFHFNFTSEVRNKKKKEKR